MPIFPRSPRRITQPPDFSNRLLTHAVRAIAKRLSITTEEAEEHCTAWLASHPNPNDPPPRPGRSKLKASRYDAYIHYNRCKPQEPKPWI